MRRILFHAFRLFLACLGLSAAVPLSGSDIDLSSSSGSTTSLSNAKHQFLPHTLTRRVDPTWFSLAPGWSAALEEYLPVAPTIFAAGAIAKLYKAIIGDCARFAAQNAAPLAHGIFRTGALEFAFEGNAPVPWAVIEGLVQLMYAFTSKGYVNTYTVWITNSQLAFRFILRVGPGSPFGPRGPP